MTQNNTILVIDDDADIREGVRELLEAQGYGVSLAENGREGLRVLELVQPFLVLLDLMMPVMNGFAFLQTIRGRPRNPPVVALTAASDGLIPREEVVDVIRKPIDVERLMSVLGRYHGDPERHEGA